MDEYKKYEPIFGSWYLNRLIGKGSFGKVFEITREEFGTTYKSALKIISVPQDDDDVRTRISESSDIESVSEYYEGILREIINENEIMSKLRGNSNIVSYEDHQIIPHEDGIGYDILIRMELLTPLLDRMVERNLDEKELVRLGIDMCKALETCHRKNIIHRDIKPQNIFISDNGDFKLGDFGIARTMEKTTGGMSKKGTYKYMAPEVFKGENYDATVDIYSLGIVLYSLLNGNRGPFLPPSPAKVTHNDEEEARMRRFRGEPIPAPKDAGPMLVYIIQKACANMPQDRYQTAAQMRKDLESYLNNYDNQTEQLLAGSTGEETVFDPGIQNYAGSTAAAQMRQTTGQYNAQQLYGQAPYGQDQFEQPREISNKTGSKKAIIIATVAAVAVIAVAGIIVYSIFSKNTKPDNMASEEVTGSGSAAEQTQPDQDDLNDMYNVYADVLLKNEYAIRSYDWQDDGYNKCVALMDLSGDGVPELMFFAVKGENSTADLHVYTYKDGNAVEYAYDNSNSMNNQGNTPDGVLFEDIHVAAGTRYIIYTGSENGIFYIGYCMGDESTYYHSNKYRISEDTKISLEREVSNKFGPNADYSGEVDEYYINGSDVSDESGKAEFKRDTDSFDTLIMYSGNVKDMNVFKKLDNNSPAAMTYDDALSLLRS